MIVQGGVGGGVGNHVIIVYRLTYCHTGDASVASFLTSSVQSLPLVTGVATIVASHADSARHDAGVEAGASPSVLAFSDT